MLLLGVWATVVGNNHAALSDTIVRIIFAAGIVGDAGLVFFSLTLLLFLCASFLRPAYNDLRWPAMISRFFLGLISAPLFVSSLVGAVALVLARRKDFPVTVPLAVPFGFRAAALLAWFIATIWAISCLAIGLSALRSRGYVGVSLYESPDLDLLTETLCIVTDTADDRILRVSRPLCDHTRNIPFHHLFPVPGPYRR